MPYQKVVAETGLEEDRWIQAVEIRPTARHSTAFACLE